MAGATVPISFPTQTVDLAKAIDVLKQSKTATDQLRESARRLGSDTQSSGRQVSSTLEGMTLRLQQLRGQIQNTSQSNTQQLQKLSSEYKALQAEIDKTNKKLFEQNQGWQTLFTSVKLFLTAGIVREVGSIALSMATLRGNVEGVSNAFGKLPNSVLILNEIRKATHGTIDDFKLMQLALKAENFGIPLRQLGNLLEFAAVRAQQTGISIDYLTESIITGIGRKSIKILDNLQINIADLNHRVKDLGISYGDAVGQIANEQLQLMGGYLFTSKTTVEQLNAEMQRLKQTLSAGWMGSVAGSFGEFIRDGIAGINNFLRGQKEINKEQAAEGVSAFLRSKQRELEQRERIVPIILGEIQRRKDLIQSIKDEILATESRLNFYYSKHSPAYIDEIDKLVKYKKAMSDRKDVMLDSLPLLQEAMNEQLKKISLDEKEIITITTMKERLTALMEEYRDNISFYDSKGLISKAKEIRQLEEEIARREDLLNVKKADKLEATEIKSIQFSIEEIEKLIKEWRKLEDAVIPTIDNIEEDQKESVGEILTVWQDFFVHLKLGFKDIKKSNEEALKEIKNMSEDAVKSLVVSNIDNEVNGYNIRIENARNYYDKLIELSGDNERRQVELRIRRDNELKKLEKQKGEAETRAAKRKVYLESAMAIARAFADYQYPYSLIVAGLVAVSTLAQINEINKAPKGYAKGVIGLKGPGTETSDSIPIMASRNESVITAEATRNSYKTLHKIQAGKLNDKVMEKIIAGNITVVGSDDRHTAKKLDELIKLTKANRPPDYVERAGMLYRVKDNGNKSRQYIRSKYGF